MSRLSQKFVMVGISGGVDSSVAALLLKNQGYHVEALFMQNWQEQTQNAQGGCNAEQDFQDAQAVCDILKIKLHLVSFAHEYWQRVFQYFLDEYAAFRTPNPDVLCNKEIKFRAFLDYAHEMGADLIATGHYARKVTLDQTEHLYKGLDANKDQSYFLHLLNQEQLKSTIFPLGNLPKEQVRKIAKEAHFINHQKKDSTGICFIGERKFKEFLQGYLLSKPGEIITREGTVIGHHDGLIYYTIGQRQGLKVGGQKNLLEAPWYVAVKDITNNRLVITQDRNDPALFAKKLICSKIHWISGYAPQLPFSCTAKIRYRHQDEQCTIAALNPDSFSVDFVNPQWAITPGQSVVFYLNEECLGGAIIERLSDI